MDVSFWEIRCWNKIETMNDKQVVNKEFAKEERKALWAFLPAVGYVKAVVDAKQYESLTAKNQLVRKPTQEELWGNKRWPGSAVGSLYERNKMAKGQ